MREVARACHLAVRMCIMAALLCVTAAMVPAQNTDAGSPWSLVRSDAGRILADAGAIFTSPARFDGPDVIKAGLACAGTVAIMSADRSVRDAAARNRSALGDRLSDVGVEYGKGLNAILLAGGVYAGGLAAGSEKVRSTGLEMFEAVVFAGTISTVTKTVLGRSRPYEEEGPWMLRGFQVDEETTSLPSGHATVAFAVSSVLASRLKNTYATIGVYSLAAVTAFSRVYDDEHWLSDTFLGAAIGTAVGCSVVALHEEGDGASHTISVQPGVGWVRATWVF